MRLIAPVCESERRMYRKMMHEACANVEDVDRTVTLRGPELARMMAMARERMKP